MWKLMSFLIFTTAVTAQSNDRASNPISMERKTIATEQPQQARAKDISPEEFYLSAQREHTPGVSPKELIEWQQQGKVLLLDVRSKESFEHSHIQGAVNLPTTELTDEKLKLIAPDPNTRIVTYCDDTLFPTRRIALTTLASPTIQQLGYKNVFQLNPLYMSEECQATANSDGLLPSSGDQQSLCNGLVKLVNQQTK